MSENITVVERGMVSIPSPVGEAGPGVDEASLLEVGI